MLLFKISVLVISLVIWTVVQNRPIQKRRTTVAAFTLHSTGLGRYVRMLENGSIIATAHTENSTFSKDTLWHLQNDANGRVRLENVAYRDHYLSLAVGEDAHALVGLNVSRPFTSQQLQLHQTTSSEETEMLEQNSTLVGNWSSEAEEESQVLVLFNWSVQQSHDYTAIQFVMMFEEMECYMAFDDSGHSEDGCSDHTHSDFTVAIQAFFN